MERPVHRKELRDKSLCTELRSYRLNRSGMNKNLRSPASILGSISNPHVQTWNRLQRFCLTSRRWSNRCMTEYLIAARAAIILWTTLAVIPAEFVFDTIEAELERRGIES